MTTLQFDKLATLLWNGHDKCWSARARDSNVFVHDKDPEQAVAKAVTPQAAPTLSWEDDEDPNEL